MGPPILLEQYLWTIGIADLSDLNTIIYGHNMKNNSMFGTLVSIEPRIL